MPGAETYHPVEIRLSYLLSPPRYLIAYPRSFRVYFAWNRRCDADSVFRRRKRTAHTQKWGPVAAITVRDKIFISLYIYLTARPGGAHPPIQRWWPGLPQLGPGGVVAAPCQPPPPPAQAHPHLGIRCHRASRPTLHKSALRPAPALRRRLPGPRARLAESMQFNACGIIDTVHHVSVAFARHTSTGLSCGGGGLGLGYI